MCESYEILMNLSPFASFRACQNGYLEQVNCLISAGAKCTAHKSTKCTPLYAGLCFEFLYFFIYKLNVDMI